MVEPQLTRLSPQRRRMFQVLGGLLLGAGAIMFFAGFIGFAVAGQSRVTSFGQSSANPFSWWLLCVFAIPLIFVGSILFKLGMVKPMSEILATETAGAVQHSTAAWGRGLGQGLKESGFQMGGEVVKVKCRSCGFLESEDARFCSKCAKAI